MTRVNIVADLPHRMFSFPRAGGTNLWIGSWQDPTIIETQSCWRSRSDYDFMWYLLLVSNSFLNSLPTLLLIHLFHFIAASTSLAVMFAIVHRRPLRDTDPFQINQVSALNYRVWRGSGFWAQLTTLVLDMLITSLIAIEVRVLFVLDHPISKLITRTCGSEPATIAGSLPSPCIEEDKYEVQEVIVNPFFQAESFCTLASSRHSREREREIEETAISMHETRPKLFSSSASCSSSSSTSGGHESVRSSSCGRESANRSLYINSIEVRRLKQQANSESMASSSSSSRELSTIAVGSSSARATPNTGIVEGNTARSTPSTTASYTNPMFTDDT